MKRLFVIGECSKEAPSWMKETPQIGSKIIYNHQLYRVDDIVFYMAESEIHIYMEIIK